MSEPANVNTMSMLVELDQKEAQLLWADLVRFKKGTKRVQRLKQLAFQGVLWERNMAPPLAQAASVMASEPANMARGIFDAPLDD